MKKFLLLALALLSLVGIASAHSIAVDPKDSNGAYITTPVYNNSGTALDAGDIVVWDLDASTGDDDAYITTTTTADTHLVAGIVWPGGIAAGASGSIAIWGIVQCDVGIGANSVMENSKICTSSTAATAHTCGAGADASGNSIGFVAIGGVNEQIDCFINQ